MKKDKIMLVLLLVVFVIIGGVMIFFAFQNEEETSFQTDAIKVKEEYEKLNNEINETTQRKYPYVELTNENPFVKKTEEQIIQILEQESGIIYFGFASCPWCRTLMPILESTAKELKIDQIYYVDIQNIRDVLALDDSNKPIVKEEGSKNYYKILERLDEFLEPYYLTDKKGKQIDTLEKRLYAPTIVAVQDGKILKVHQGTIETQESGFDELSDSQKKELTKIVKDVMTSIHSSSCQKDAC